MQPWEIAVEQFINTWIENKDVVGALVCGSYITGEPSNRSDIDIHLILSEDVEWRERGNCIIDGLLIEYFSNPPQQIRYYFQEDYNDQRTMAMVQFITGKVIFDHIGVIEQLKQEALHWKSKTYDNLSPSLIEIKKYTLWDAYDNLLDCYEQKRFDFSFVYNNSLCDLFDIYCSVLQIEQIPHYQISLYLTETSYLRKYMKQAFPDQQFKTMFIEALKADEEDNMIHCYKILTEYVLKETGGFNIDGWKLRSKLQLS
ncbi:nucleotidyltransferase domain-containing protein [Paenibacillus endoradicis]|uniref:nucleotidyltransferase domain-containing protein n=1 Tax=Paenibacillus endoradicis TaxID=2972487 RepID=UPI0021595027|nr:nucleotidyltransferase domain-containing protein [Paenibacillus endoradicis]MCR8656627.1 nucleotidyltransferase domain-containing protein [Paenibacillus endoradicis]